MRALGNYLHPAFCRDVVGGRSKMLPRHYFYLQAVMPQPCSTRRMNKALMHKLNTGMHMRVERCSLLA